MAGRQFPSMSPSRATLENQDNDCNQSEVTEKDRPRRILGGVWPSPVAQHQAGRSHGISPIIYGSIFSGGAAFQAEPWPRASGGAREIIRWSLFHVESPWLGCCHGPCLAFARHSGAMTRSPPDPCESAQSSRPALDGSNCGFAIHLPAAIQKLSSRMEERSTWNRDHICVKCFAARQALTRKRSGHAPWRGMPISTDSLIRSAVRATPSLDFISVAVLATVL